MLINSLLGFHLQSLFFLFFNALICCYSAEAAYVSSLKSNSVNRSFPAVIAFGDSIFDTGNNNLLNTSVKCNFPPYGRDFFQGKPTGRFSNGKITLDFVVELLGIKEEIPPFSDPTLKVEDLATGISFASGGSGFDPLTPKAVSVISMHGQLELLKQYKAKLEMSIGLERSAGIVADSLYIVAAGSDDIVNTYFHTNLRRNNYTISNYTDFLTNSASSFFQELYDIGARHINLIGLSPLGCLPIIRTVAGGFERQCGKKYNDAAQLFNTKMAERFEYLNRLLPLAKFNHVDSYTTILNMIQHPRTYGFEVADRGCCGSGLIETILLCNRWSPLTCSNASSFLFWDSYHPSEKGNRIITEHLIRKLR